MGLCSVSFRNHTVKEILSAMKEAKLDFIEWGSDVHAPKNDTDKLKEIAVLQAEYGIKCSSYGTYFKLGTDSVDGLTEYIGAAKILGTDTLRLWCGNKNSEDYLEKEKALLFESCKKASEIAKRHNVTLCMECHINTYTNKNKSALELMEKVNCDNFKMYWQPNQFLSDEENLESAGLLSPHTVNIHVFNWKDGEKYPLDKALGIWKSYLGCFDKNKTLLLEFMPDDSINSLRTEAEALKEIIK